VDKKIAILGWGSLIWNKGILEIKSEWLPDGPFLPIEFARISGVPKRERYLSLVINHGSSPVQTLYALSSYQNLEDAINNLMEREEIGRKHSIGFIDFITQYHNSRNENEFVLDILKKWNKPLGYDAVIWTDLKPNFENVFGRPLSLPNCYSFLGSLNSIEFSKSKEYILQAPKQTITDNREQLENYFS